MRMRRVHRHPATQHTQRSSCAQQQPHSVSILRPTCAQALALGLHGREEGGAVDDVEHAARHVADQRVARERGAVVACVRRVERGSNCQPKLNQTNPN